MAPPTGAVDKSEPQEFIMPEKFKHLLGTSDWEGMWSTGVERGMIWDIGKCEPDLVHELKLRDKGSLGSLFATKTGDLSSLKALVPGCGRGYAVAAIAEAGIPALGLEISPTAAEIARKDCPQERAEYRVGDFFDQTSGIGPFNLIFDSTFLCAISPKQWRPWAKRTVSLLAPGGLLALQVFPVYNDSAQDPDHPVEGESSPPYSISPNLVRALLEPYSKEMEEIACRETPQENAARQLRPVPMRKERAKEYWMVFRKKTQPEA
jgi:SAM-dependent methyltransferase